MSRALPLISPDPRQAIAGASTGGITAADVDRAADALLRAGQRPTIEKVRLEIGRGSPNTINPLLDAWWSRLAGRLDAGPAALHERSAFAKCVPADIIPCVPLPKET